MPIRRGKAGCPAPTPRNSSQQLMRDVSPWPCLTLSMKPGIDVKTFLEQAEVARKNCPLSKALAAVGIMLNATLVS